jgi:pyruvate dehydrogenase E1 component beta subunit
VIFIEGEILYGLQGEVPEEEYTIPMGKGDVKREGKDCTVISWSRMVHTCTEAAEELAKQGIDVEVIDLRSLRPFDKELLSESIKKTNRVVIVEEGWPWVSVGGAVGDWIARELFDWLDAPVGRLHQRDVPMPYAFNLEAASLPGVEAVIDAVKKATYSKP